jgi:hypothetical protein
MMSEANTVAAILIDPDQRTITQTRVPVVLSPEEERGWSVNNIPLEALYARLECREFGAFPMPGCEADSVFYNDEMLEADGKNVAFFQLGEGWEPIAGRCLVVGFDMATHEYRDPVTTIEQLEARVIRTRRIVRDYQVTKIEDGVRIDRVAPIVDEQ